MPLAPSPVGNFLRTKQRSLEGIDRGNVRLGSALTLSDAKTGAADVGAAACGNFSLFAQRVDHRWIEHRNIEGFASLNLLLDVGVYLEMEIDCIAGCAFKLRAQLAHGGFSAVAAQDLDFSRLCDRSHGQ